ncbi:DUF2934 domain-containing protein [Methylotetracoccus oryzae]|uniref:DUF2934 domain-containing protein n=1 Tax=Methylotetracoccus oryzae TaxID=1919059 RepID=UPI001F3AFC82|nr:DUF2934 domain-containing protein [Methylotetracoccus oryzae]
MPTHPDERARRVAEERAQRTLELAAGRAEAIAADAAARAAALGGRLDLKTPTFHSAARDEMGHARPAISADGLREAIALRAYFRAEQRSFEPGWATEDWLEAEREVSAAALALADEGES